MPESESEFLPAVRRARIDRLDIYEISDSELQQLERGSPDSLFLTFSIFLLSTSLNATISLPTTQIESPRIFIVFVVVAVVGAAGGALLLALWRWYSRSRAHILKQVRSRMRPDAMIGGEAIQIDTTAVDQDGGDRRL